MGHKIHQSLWNCGKRGMPLQRDCSAHSRQWNTNTVALGTWLAADQLKNGKLQMYSHDNVYSLIWKQTELWNVCALLYEHTEHTLFVKFQTTILLVFRPMFYLLCSFFHLSLMLFFRCLSLSSRKNSMLSKHVLQIWTFFLHHIYEHYVLNKEKTREKEKERERENFVIRTTKMSAAWSRKKQLKYSLTFQQGRWTNWLSNTPRLTSLWYGPWVHHCQYCILYPCLAGKCSSKCKAHCTEKTQWQLKISGKFPGCHDKNSRNPSHIIRQTLQTL